jgi:hypothetical protein
VYTNRYNNQRTGAITSETILTPATVGGAKFALLFSLPVDGTITAQPLYVPGLTIGGAMHNIVFVATQHNSVYAFDADHAPPAAPAPPYLWTKSMGPAPTKLQVPTMSCNDLQPETGITSTPTIDTSNPDPNMWTLFVEAKTIEGAAFHHRLHALSVTDGSDRVTAADVAGTQAGQTFNAQIALQRPGLLLDNGTVYLGFASHCDGGAYHGWVMAYDAKTLTQQGVFLTTPTTTEGGIWQSGMGMSADGKGGVYFVAGNSNNHAATAYKAGDYGLTAGRLTLDVTTKTFTVADFWTESDFSNLNVGDYDLTSSAVLDPGSNLVFVGAKDGKIHVLDRTNMGKYTPPAGTMPADKIVQTVPLQFTLVQYKSGHSHGGPVIWNGPSGMRMFTWPEQGPVQVFAVTPTAAMPVNPMPVMSPSSVPNPPHPGGMLTLSSNGAMPGTGILWAGVVPNPALDAWHTIVPGSLYAFDAEHVEMGPIWTSDKNATRDALGLFSKFCAPTVANGHVYIGTANNTNMLRVYGLLP